MDRREEIEDLLDRIRWAFDQYSDLESIRLTVTHFVGLVVGLVEEELSEMKSEAKK